MFFSRSLPPSNTMTYSERLIRNTILLNLAESGLTQTQIGLVVGLGQQAVSHIIQQASHGLPVCAKHLGATPRLGAEERAKLPGLLKKGAESFGFKGDYWTCNRVGFVMEQAYGVVYEAKQVGRILAQLEWTRQKPQPKAPTQRCPTRRGQSGRVENNRIARA